MTPLRIVELRAESFKRLVAVDISPTTDVVQITGRNGAGKSSVLDAIAETLGGTSSKNTPRPIRDGEDHAEVTVDLGDFTVTRKWTSKGTSTLTVTAKDGAKYSSPQAFLDEKLGALSFDPLAFAHEDPKKQVATLLELVDLPFDPDEMNEQRKLVYNARTEVGRVVKALEGQLSALPATANDLPDEEISTAHIFEEQAAYSAASTAFERAGRSVSDQLDEVRRREQAVEELRLQLADMESMLAVSQTRLANASEVVAGLEVPFEIDFTRRLEEVEATNRLIRASQDTRRIVTELEMAREQFEGMTAELEEFDTLKTESLAAAKMPIDGLAFDDDGVTYRGVPFKQCSSAEQLRVSMAMAIAANPTIRVCLIRDGSLLDSTNMKLIEEMARESKSQVWVERVDESGEIGFVVEDGVAG